MANIEPRNDGGPFQYVVTAEAQLSSIFNPKVGQFSLALAEGTLWFHTGSAWQQCGGAASSGSATFVSTAKWGVD